MVACLLTLAACATPTAGGPLPGPYLAFALGALAHHHHSASAATTSDSGRPATGSRRGRAWTRATTAATRPTRTAINRPVPAGRGRTKPCNTTGTATNAGYPEHEFTWAVAPAVRDS